MTAPALRVRLLGPLTLSKAGVELPLRASRKVRALLAFLAVAPAAVTRSRICELLCDTSDDPRGELRWCLSRLRSVLDDPQRGRIEARGDTIALNLSDCFVDTTEITSATQAGIERLDLQRLRTLHGLFAGDFAEGLETDCATGFGCWLSAERRRFRGIQVAVLEQLVARFGHHAAESFEYLEKWLQLRPLDTRAHQILLSALLRSGRCQEGEEHVAATIRLFEAEGLDWQPLHGAWRTARSKAQGLSSSISAKTTLAERVATGVRSSSICVMPFSDRACARTSDARGGPADGLTEDIITRLAKVRSLFVIARGSVFALDERHIPADEAGRLLNVDYVVSGSVRQLGERITVTAELAEARGARIVWSDHFTCRMEDTLAIPEDIADTIVAAIVGEVEAAERKRAVLKPPNGLNAWEACHRGLWHMYRFNGADNALAAHFFEMAVKQDPAFARAWAGLSFTHFQNAFLHRTGERDTHVELAYATAAHALNGDDRDPAAHWAFGRALWLRGQQQEALAALQESVRLSPNFALGHYTLGFVQGQSGDPREAIAATDYSRHLSPFDPLLFAMFATRAVALARLGDYEQAADWALKGAIRPNAHVHAMAVAAQCLALAGRYDEAHPFVATLHRTAPAYQLEDFFNAFRFDGDTMALFRRNAGRLGLA